MGNTKYFMEQTAHSQIFYQYHPQSLRAIELSNDHLLAGMTVQEINNDNRFFWIDCLNSLCEPATAVQFNQAWETYLQRFRQLCKPINAR